MARLDILEIINQRVCEKLVMATPTLQVSDSTGLRHDLSDWHCSHIWDPVEARRVSKGKCRQETGEAWRPGILERQQEVLGGGHVSKRRHNGRGRIQRHFHSFFCGLWCSFSLQIKIKNGFCLWLSSYRGQRTISVIIHQEPSTLCFEARSLLSIGSPLRLA